MRVVLLGICLAFSGLSAVAAVNQNENLNATAPSFQEGRWYTLETTAIVSSEEVMDSQGRFDHSRDHQVMTLVPGTDFYVLELRDHKSKAVIAFNLEGQDDDALERLPSQMVVSLAELLKARSSVVELNQEVGGEEADDDFEERGWQGDLFPIETDVAGRASVRKARRGIQRPLKAVGNATSRILRVFGKGGMTMCLAEVRVNAKKTCDQVMPVIGRAAEAYTTYRNAGWRPVDYDPDNAAVCTACFWNGGRTDCGGKACGHASLKMSANTWVGAGVRANPRLPDQDGCTVVKNKKGKVVKKLCRIPYELQGCLVAPGH